MWQLDTWDVNLHSPKKSAKLHTVFLLLLWPHIISRAPCRRPRDCRIFPGFCPALYACVRVCVARGRRGGNLLRCVELPWWWPKRYVRFGSATVRFSEVVTVRSEESTAALWGDGSEERGFFRTRFPAKKR